LTQAFRRADLVVAARNLRNNPLEPLPHMRARRALEPSGHAGAGG
jgi:hypothetical protein